MISVFKESKELKMKEALEMCYSCVLKHVPPSTAINAIITMMAAVNLSH